MGGGVCADEDRVHSHGGREYPKSTGMHTETLAAAQVRVEY